MSITECVYRRKQVLFLYYKYYVFHSQLHAILQKREPSEKCLEQVCESNAISLLGHKFVTFVVPRMETNNEN